MVTTSTASLGGTDERHNLKRTRNYSYAGTYYTLGPSYGRQA